MGDDRMTADSTLSLAFRHYTVLFLIAAALTVPLHLFHSAFFADVVAVTEIHPAIEELDGDRRVRGVGAADLARYRGSYLTLMLVEIALLPLVIGAGEQALRDSARGRAPGVLRSWALSVSGALRLKPLRAVRAPGALAAALITTVIVGVLIERMGMLVVGPLPRSTAWLVAGLAGGLARAAAAPFLVAAIVRAGGPGGGDGNSAKGGHPAAPTL